MKTIAKTILFGMLYFNLIHSAHAAIQPMDIPAMITAESSSEMNLIEAANYCRALNTKCDVKVDGTTCGTEMHKGWRIPSSDELGWFLGLSSSEKYLWTRTQYHELDKYIILSLKDGSWGWAGYAAKVTTRCVK